MYAMFSKTQPTTLPGSSVDATRSNLVRRLLDARYGPGYSIVDGRLVQDQPKPMMAGWPANKPMDLCMGQGRGESRRWHRARAAPNGNDFRLGFSLGNNFPTINYRSDYSYGDPPRLYRSFYSAYEDWDRYHRQLLTATTIRT